MSNTDWLKLNRSMLGWEWYKDINTKIVFLHLLLNAQWHEGRYMGYELKPGQVIFGRKKYAEELGLSERSVRTAINHLKSTNEITTKVTNKFTIVTIENWAKYQGTLNETDQQTDQQNAQRATNNRPASDQQVTTYKNERMKRTSKKNKKKKDYFSLPLDERIKIALEGE